jgi:hypothetical protein
LNRSMLGSGLASGEHPAVAGDNAVLFVDQHRLGEGRSGRRKRSKLTVKTSMRESRPSGRLFSWVSIVSRCARDRGPRALAGGSGVARCRVTGVGWSVPPREHQVRSSRAAHVRSDASCNNLRYGTPSQRSTRPDRKSVKSWAWRPHKSDAIRLPPFPKGLIHHCH